MVAGPERINTARQPSRPETPIVWEAL